MSDRAHRGADSGGGRRSRLMDTAGLGALWASAFVLAGLVLVLAGQRGIERRALADVTEVGDLVVLTVDTGGAEDVVAILDGQDESLFVYGVQGNRSVELYVAEDVATMFANAKTQTGGGR